MTAARPGPSLGEVIAKALGALEIHVVQLVAGPVGSQMHQNSDAQGCRSGDVDLLRAQQRNVPKPDAARGGGREYRVDIGRGGEHHADQVVVVDTVAVEHDLDERLGALGDLLDSVGVDRGRAAQGADGFSHRSATLVRWLADGRR